MIRWHKNDLDNRMYCNLKDGLKCTMPRYYKLRLYTEEEREKAGKATRYRMLEQEDKVKEKLGKAYYRNKSESHFANQLNAKRREAQNQKL